MKFKYLYTCIMYYFSTNEYLELVLFFVISYVILHLNINICEIIA
jgi:hypothetical protein